MRDVILTGTVLVLLLLPVSAISADDVAVFRLTDFRAYLELEFRNNVIGNESIGVETEVDDTRQQIELGASTSSYMFHPKLLRMHIAGSLLSDRQRITREQLSALSGDPVVSRSRRKELLLNLDATFQFLKDKPFPTTISYSRGNPIANTGVEGSFTQETERVGVEFQLRDILPFNLSVNAFRDSSFGESLDRIIDRSTERVSVKAKKSFSQGNRLALDYESSNQESRNGDPRRPIQETIRRAQRLLLTSSSRLGSEGQFRINQSASINRRDETNTTDIQFSPRLVWLHTSALQSRYQYSFSESDRPESGFKNTAEEMSASLHYSPSDRLNGLFRARADRSNEGDRLSQNARGLSGRANIRRDSELGQFNLSLGLGYRLDDRQSQSPRVMVEEESVTFTGAGPINLLRDFVIAETVVVENETGTQIYIEGLDYVLSQLGSLTRIERLINGSILEDETVLVDYEAETGGTFEYSQVDQTLSADFSFAKYHNIFFRYLNSRQNLQSGLPTVPFNSVKALEIGLRERIPLRWGGIQLFGEARYRRQDEDINPFNQASLTLSVQAPLAQRLQLNASVSRSIVDNLLSVEDSDLIVFNANLTWKATRNLTIRAEGNYDEDTGGTLLRSNIRWKMNAQWRFRKISLQLDTRYMRQQQGDLNNNHHELWLRIRRELF